MTTPSVSVVIPVGRVDDALAAQVRAVAAQDFDGDVEIVLALNASGDVPARELRALAGGIEPARVVDATARRGASYARNTGAAAASAGVLAFCDADDLVHRDWLAPLVAALDGWDAVGGRLVDVGVDERQRSIRPPATPDELPTFLGHPYIVSASMALRRDTFDAVGGFDEHLVRCEDIALSWSLLVAGCTLGFAGASCVDYAHRPGLVALMKQHFLYGRGMSQVLVRYGLPAGTEWMPPHGTALLKPNAQPGGASSLAGTLRRGAIAAGRVVGIGEERWRSARAHAAAPGRQTLSPSRRVATMRSAARPSP